MLQAVSAEMVFFFLAIVYGCLVEVPAIAIQSVSIPANADVAAHSMRKGALHKTPYFLNSHGHDQVTPALQKGAKVGSEQGFNAKADCDGKKKEAAEPALLEGSLRQVRHRKPSFSAGGTVASGPVVHVNQSVATTPPPGTDTYPSSFSWRLRIDLPCKVDDETVESYEWDLYDVQYFGERCENATTPITPAESWVSGRTDVSFNKEMALDGDPTTKWQGKADEDNNVWLEVRFAKSTAVKCVRFLQCDCLRSAKEVVLDFIPDEMSEEEWMKAKVISNITWGEESFLDTLPLAKDIDLQ